MNTRTQKNEHAWPNYADDDVSLCSTGFPGGNQVDGLPPAQHTGAVGFCRRPVVKHICGMAPGETIFWEIWTLISFIVACNNSVRLYCSGFHIEFCGIMLWALSYPGRKNFFTWQNWPISRKSQFFEPKYSFQAFRVIFSDFLRHYNIGSYAHCLCSMSCTRSRRIPLIFQKIFFFWSSKIFNFRSKIKLPSFIKP